jgi:nitroreductase
VTEPTRRLIDLIRRRLTAEGFEPGETLDEQTIREIVDDAIQAPSSFNIQHWRFVAVRRREDLERLCAAAYGQRQVADCATAIILLGDLRGIEKLPQAMRHAVESGAIPEKRADNWVKMAEAIYADEQLARDEAIRSCSLAAMNLMLSAEARGLGTGVLIGFDADAVRREFGVPERYLPVMLVTVGRPASRGRKVRKPRFAVDEVLRFDRCDFDPD